MRAVAISAFLCGLIANLGQALYYYPLLPSRVASHFDAAGAANGWMTRGACGSFYIAISSFVAIVLLIPAISIPRTPDRLINLPNKTYWLAPERRAETFAYWESFFLWYGAAVQLLLLDIFRQTFRVNLGHSRTLEHPKESVACFVVFSIAAVVHSFRRFSRVPERVG